MEDVRREVAVMKKLAGSPYVVNLHRAFEDDEHVHIVMDLCEGGDLFDELTKKGRLPEMEACTLFAEVAKAVAHCHANGILHRDVKPENVLLCHTCSPTSPFINLSSHMFNDSPIKLADFGLSVIMDGDKLVYGVAGSPFYLAPEILSGGYGLPADVWSLGVVLFMMLSGTAPFGGASEDEVLACVRRGKFGFKHAIWGSISPRAKDLIRRMLHMSPAERPTAKQVLDHEWFKEMGAPTHMIERCCSSKSSSSLGSVSSQDRRLSLAATSSSARSSSGSRVEASPPESPAKKHVVDSPALSPVSHLGYISDFSPAMSQGSSAGSSDGSPGALVMDSQEYSPAQSLSPSSVQQSPPESPNAVAGDQAGQKKFMLPTAAVEKKQVLPAGASAFKATDPELVGQLHYVDWVFGF